MCIRDRLDGQTLLVPGFAPDALAPLWQALRESSAHPQLELVEEFYQVLYLSLIHI